MKTYETEPDCCENCGEGEEMTCVSGATIDGLEGPHIPDGHRRTFIADGWLCYDCGHFHLKANTKKER